MNSKVLSMMLFLALFNFSHSAILSKKKPGRNLIVRSVGPSAQVENRKLGIFSSDEKTREIIKLRKEIANSEGLIKQYEGQIIR